MRSFDPRTGAGADAVADSSPTEVEAALMAAAEAFPIVAAHPPAVRADWLESWADALERNVDELVGLADDETALGLDRLTGELSRTAANARYYAHVGARGDWLRTIVDTVPGAPSMDLRRAHLPMGPVAVFAASNFPFQFGVGGHDTCSALAVGAPVVCKAHPSQPRLSARLGELLRSAVESAGAPEGTFSLVAGFDAGLALVDSDVISAVGFTGSQAGGMALVERASRRPRPIPVFAEMGTVNPVVVTVAAQARALEVAEGLVASFTLGVGQFCTKPGLALVPRGSALTDLIAQAVASASGGWLLNEGIARAWESRSAELAAAGTELARGTGPSAGYAAAPVAVGVSLADLAPGSQWLEECFGPVLLVAEYGYMDEATAALSRLQPSLAAAVWTDGTGDDPDAPVLVQTLARQVGRVVVDGWPTGVACADGMQHGGPWPATSRPEATSVGAAALGRWTRPVSFQDVPQAALPPCLADDDPWNVRGGIR